MKKLIIFIAFLVALVPSLVGAAPTIDGQSGTCTNGNTCTFTSSNSSLGAGATIYDFIGPSVLNGGSGVFSRTNWWVPNSPTTTIPVFSSGQVYSGTQSLGNVGYNGCGSGCAGNNIYDGTYGYVFSSSPSTVYASFRIFRHKGTTTLTQHKIERFMPYQGLTDQDGELLFTQWTDTNYYIFLFCKLSEMTTGCPCYPNSDYGNRYYSHPLIDDQWGRHEVYVQQSSSPGTRDGTLEFYVHDGTNPVWTNAKWDGTIITRDTGVTDQWLDLVFENYIGNNAAGDDRSAWKIYMSDIYIASSPARIEIGNKSTWAACTHRDIQPHTSWAAGSATVTLTIGSFSAAEIAAGLYAYAIDSSGNVSAGVLVILGGGSTWTVTPVAGTGCTMSPGTAQTVSNGDTQSFTVGANTGYTISSVTGCGGSWSSSPYVTGAITGNCTVTATCAGASTHTVTVIQGAHCIMSPSTNQTITDSASPQITFAPSYDYALAFTNNCGGTASGTNAASPLTYGPVTGDCTIATTCTAKQHPPWH